MDKVAKTLAGRACENFLWPNGTLMGSNPLECSYTPQGLKMEAKKNPAADIHTKRGLLFSLSLVIVLALVISAFEWRSESNSSDLLRDSDYTNETMLDIPVTDQTLPPPPNPTVNKVVEVPDEEEIREDIKVAIDLEMQEEVSELPEIKVVEQEVEETDEIFTVVEQRAEFPGGNKEFAQFLINNMKYPGQARRLEVQGKVFVRMIVDKNGVISNAQVIKGIGAGCDEEALRVIAISPPWQPARQRGRAVKSVIVVPLVFTLQ